MKRLITFVCLIVIVVVGYTLINEGYEKNNFKIASYNTIEKKSEALTKKLASYDKRNQDDYESAVSSLDSSIKTYKNSKAKYEAILEEMQDVLNAEQAETPEENVEELIYSDKEKYKVDFLLVTLGDYGEKEGVDVVYQLTTSSTTDPNSSTFNYFLSDLKFTVTGQYMDVANFISDLENDEKLGWEIREFTMESGSSGGYSGVTAKFTIKDVPIDSESYIASTAPSQDGEGETTNPDGTTNTTAVAGDTNTTVDTTNTTNEISNSVDNTTDVTNTTNTVSNNTVY